MKHQIEANYILSLLKSAIHGSDVTLPPKELNWNIVTELAKSHRVYTPMYFALQRLPKDVQANIPTLSAFQLAYKQYLVMDANRDYYSNLIKADLDAAGVDHILLKGSVSKHLYPETSMRVMRDIDILYRNATDDTLVDIFENHGFYVSKKEPKEISFKMEQPPLHIELQNHLVNELYTDWFNYLKDIWTRCEKIDSHEYVMNNEDFYIYHIIHMAKHFKNGGIGLIHILDTYMINQGMTLDKQIINKELDKIGLTRFEYIIGQLANSWFGDSLADGLDDFASETLITYIFQNGAFGRKSQEEINRAIQSNLTHISWRRKLFPNITTIADYYGDYVKKHPWSLPLYWIKLNVERLCRGKNNIKKSVTAMTNIKDEDIEKTKTLFDYCGLR